MSRVSAVDFGDAVNLAWPSEALVIAIFSHRSEPTRLAHGRVKMIALECPVRWMGDCLDRYLTR